jgi:ribonuclease HI
MLERAIIYTDGAVSGNGAAASYGGWAVVVRFGAYELELSGTERGASNQQMELRAAIEGLRALDHPHRVQLYSDSSYLVECFRQAWWRRWRENGWRNSRGHAVANRALWEELLALTAVHAVSFFKVAGHAGDALNERCDRLAVAARERLAAELAHGS